MNFVPVNTWECCIVSYVDLLLAKHSEPSLLYLLPAMVQRLNIIQCIGSLCHDKCKFCVNIPFSDHYPFSVQSFVCYNYASSITAFLLICTSGSFQVGCKQRRLNISKTVQERFTRANVSLKRFPLSALNLP